MLIERSGNIRSGEVPSARRRLPYPATPCHRRVRRSEAVVIFSLPHQTVTGWGRISLLDALRHKHRVPFP